jgi:hypothetical protein
MTKEQGTFHWGHEALHLEFALHEDGNPRLTHLGPPGGAQRGLDRPGPQLRGTAARVDVLSPSGSPAFSAWLPGTAELSPALPTAPSAVLLRMTPTAAGAP